MVSLVPVAADPRMTSVPGTPNVIGAPSPSLASDSPNAIESVLVRFRAVAVRAGAAHGLQAADVDEVLQDVRIRLWRAGHIAGKLEAITSSYIYRAATSAALDLLRRRRARRDQMMDAVTPDDGRLASTLPAPDGSILASETVSAVAAALDELAPNRQAVVRLHLAGYDREEIAGLLRWSEAKTRNLLYRGLDDLRRGLRNRGIGPGGAV